MNAPKVIDLDYIQFLIAMQGVYTCTEAARAAAFTARRGLEDHAAKAE